MTLWRIAPASVRVRGAVCQVIQTVIHPPGSHKLSPIKNDLTALELKTRYGSRWYGIRKGYIGSDLCMHVEIPSERFTEMEAWDVSEGPHPPSMI